MLKFVSILSVSIFWITSIGARPGMGNSYRSSSSSSSSSRSTYSSYKPSSTSSSSSSKSNYSSNSYSTSSTPEPTSYFETTNHNVSVHLFADGSADVNETFRIKKDQSKIGIRRPTFLIQNEAEIEELAVLPEQLYSSHNAGIITIFWPDNQSNPEMEISLKYRIKQAYIPIGNVSLINWRFSKTSFSSNPFVLDLKWEQETFSQQFRIQEEIFNSSTSDYERKNLQISKNDLQFHYNQPSNSQNNSLVVIDVANFRNLSNSKTLQRELEDSQKRYTLEETVTIHDNGIHAYRSKIQISKNNPKVDSLQLQLGLNRFREFGESIWNQFWTPAFQISYAFEGLSTYFWHLFSVTLSESQDEPNDKKLFTFAFKTIGETTNLRDQGIERWVRITSLEKNDQLVLEKFSLNVLCESQIDPTLTNIEIIARQCEYCSDTLDQNSIIIPVQLNWEANGFSLQWDHPIPSNYLLFLKIKEKDKKIIYNPILIFYAVFNAFLHSPGSGNHLGHLTALGILSICLLIFGFFFFNKNQKGRFQKKLHQSIISQIQEFDPTFDFNQFKEKVITITEKTVTSWDKGDMEPSRNFLSAAVFQRFSIQLNLMKVTDGEVNRMKGFKVLTIQIINFTIEAEYVTLHLKLKCKTKDKTFLKHTSELEIQNTLEKEPYVTYEEIHSYTRKIETRTKPNVDLIHHLCPSCGASPKFAHPTNRCEYCGVIFNSGQADWVLTEITQTVEWDTTNVSNLKSLPNEVTKQLLEDRASTIFWKYIHYQSIPNSQILFRESSDQSYLKLGKPGNEPMFSPVVGSCHLVNFEKESKPQRMSCEIRWSVARKKGLLPEHRRSRITLVLPSERPKSLGFSEISCENCGAPLPEVDSSACGYCQKVIPGKISDWLFESIQIISL
ncbi:TIM44-like domain-containing protein [Leptospira bouyouniensis]|uniref:Transport protein n=1 Tax=Leptospira bouyouniensis TaxID=2484911 RepID=A0ABY2L953_9LEPT|nr:TIM44-like domain-containing protein [Leptospira bouyouniensis]TGK53190.1 transport protein [Leptospira bouyouniensis]